MNLKIIELRQVIQKLVPLLTGKGLEVTQRGARAYVKTDTRTQKPVSVNIPMVPENSSDEFISAIQGFIDHEVAHVLITDWKYYGGGPTPAQLSDPKVQAFINTHNILEDTMIEREIVKIFPGAKMNIANLRDHFIKRITKPVVDAAKTDKEKFIYLLVPAMRALAGHEEFQDYMDAGKHWANPYVAEMVKSLDADFIKKLKSCTTTKETLELSRVLHDVLYPPTPAAPPPPPMPAPPPPSSKSEDKPEKKAEEGDGDGERDHSESEEGEDNEDEAGDAGEADDEADGEAGADDEADGGGTGGKAESKSKDKSKGKDKSEKEKFKEEGEKDESDGSGDADAAEEGDDEGDDEDESEGADEGSDASNDDLEDDGDDEAEATSGADASGEDVDEDEEGEGGKSGSKEDESEEDSSESEAGEGSSTPGGETESWTDDKIKEDSDSDGDSDIHGVGSTTSKSMFDFDDDAFEAVDISSKISQMISKTVEGELTSSREYVVFTREMDQIEPLKVPENMNQNWVPEMEAEVASMTGQMQKDIERIMASQSHVLRTPGHKRGKLHAPSLYRVTQGDPRVFTQKEEHVSKDTAVTLLIDNSGSMSGAKMHLAMIAGYALSATLDRVKIAHEVLGFTTGGWGSMPRSVQEALQEEQKTSWIAYDRNIPIIMPIYKSFDERMSPTVKQRIAYAMRAQNGLAGNIDGESVEYAAIRLARRQEKRKVMLVLSDGQPAGGPKGDPHLRYVIRMMEEKMRIETIGIGIMDDSVKRYYPKNVVLNNAKDLPGQVMGEIKKLLI